MADDEHNNMDPMSGFFDDDFAAIQAVADWNVAFDADVNMASASAPNVSSDVNMDSPSDVFGSLTNQPVAGEFDDIFNMDAGEFDGIDNNELLAVENEVSALVPTSAPGLTLSQIALYGLDAMAAPHYPPPSQPVQHDQPSPFDRQFDPSLVDPQLTQPQFVQPSQLMQQPQLTLPQTIQSQLTFPQLIQPPQPNVPQQNPPQPNLAQPAVPQPAVPQPADPQAAGAQPAGRGRRRSPLAAPRLYSKRSRKGQAGANDPSEIYSKPTGLAPWGPRVRADRNELLYHYYMRSAELHPKLVFNKNQLADFFSGVGHPNPRRSLTLWIQNTAAQVNDRYAAGAESSKCRYEGCVVNHRTILKGLYRVAFDEFSDRTSTELDPMHNAGYMHLHCFEKIFDLGYLIHHGAVKAHFGIEADTRHFTHEERNPAALTRDHASMAEAYNAWVKGQEDRANEIEARNATLPPQQQYSGFAPTADMILPHEQRLGCALIEHHLSLQNAGRKGLRDKRGGIHIALYKGDLDLLAQLKREKKQAGKGPSASADDDDDDDDDGSPAPRAGGAYQGRLRSHTPQPQPNPRKRGADDDGDGGAEQSAPKRRRGNTPPDAIMEDAGEGSSTINVGGSVQPMAQQAPAAPAVPLQPLLNAPQQFPAAQQPMYQPQQVQQPIQPQQAYQPQQAFQPQQPQQVQQAFQSQQFQQPIQPQPQPQPMQQQQMQPPPQHQHWHAQILPGTGPFHNDGLAGRIGVLTRVERREVSGQGAKIERREGPRKRLHSMKACVVALRACVISHD